MMLHRFGRTLTLILAVSLVSVSPAQQPFILTDGTAVRLRLNRNLSSADARVGDPVDFEVLEDVILNGVMIIQRGSSALATVTEAKQKGRMGKAGKLDVNIDHARSLIGEKVTLRAVKENQGGSSTGKMTGAMVATSIVFFPAAPLFLFMKGKDVTISKGTEITAFVHGDARLDEARFRAHPANGSVAGATPVFSAQATPALQTTPAQTPIPAAQPASVAPPLAVPTSAPTPASAPPKFGMSNGDVVELKRAGFSDDLIVSKIRSSQCAFRLETSDMLDLKKAGLSDKVIAAMMEKLK
jgi:hypothetical protein